jgi:hypothetical protein
VAVADIAFAVAAYKDFFAYFIILLQKKYFFSLPRKQNGRDQSGSTGTYDYHDHPF